MAFLELKGLAKGFGAPGAGRKEVLGDIDLEIEQGEFVAIVGYSGSGKTTLLSMIAGLLEPDSGEVRLDGQPVTGPGPDRAVVFQNYSLLPWLTVTGNIALAVDRVFADWSPERRRDQVNHFIDMVNLSHARDRRPGELSGGMRQRVSLARALAMNPSILLLDEPLGALDALTRATLQGEIERLWAEDRKTVVMITNDVDEGLLLADRIVPLGTGPRATLGPAIRVDLDRPRDRQAVNHDPRYRELRMQVLDYLLACKPRTDPVAARARHLPDLMPDLMPDHTGGRGRFWNLPNPLARWRRARPA